MVTSLIIPALLLYNLIWPCVGFQISLDEVSCAPAYLYEVRSQLPNSGPIH